MAYIARLVKRKCDMQRILCNIRQVDTRIWVGTRTSKTEQEAQNDDL